jgi:poly-gamma-glutamate capsule biosynthesis protein CapA/YwtB (metallophosphatase superfamily)
VGADEGAGSGLGEPIGETPTDIGVRDPRSGRAGGEVGRVIGEGDVRAAARSLSDAGASLVAGTSAHVFHGVEGDVRYDLGDFIDDYAVDPRLRNDHSLLFLVELEPDGLRGIEAVPIRLEYAHARLARGEEADWIRRRFRQACAALGTEASEENGRLAIAKY